MTTTTDAARDGHNAATEMITRQADAGMTAERISEQQADWSAHLLSEADSPDGRAYAEAYDNAAQALAADLMQDYRMSQGAAPMAAQQRDGTPHADPFLASKGWHADGGVYVSGAHAVPDRYREIRVTPDREAGR